MIVYHVCSPKKYLQYHKYGGIKSPVRAWENIQQAERMSLSTGRPIILRLKFPSNAKKLEGHFNQARILTVDYKFPQHMICNDVIGNGQVQEDL